MNILKTYGSLEVDSFTKRPTVKVLITRGDNEVLILNKGLLPGGGINPHESHLEAITRELQEELGASVQAPRYIGTVVQYRSYLGKKYEVHGYAADLNEFDGTTNPQDEGEANFKVHWMTPADALDFVGTSIALAKKDPIKSDDEQGRLFNLMTTHALLKQYVAQ